MKTKKETFVYEGLGFPIELIDCPMKKMFGEWVIDINLNALQRFVFNGLIHKPYPFTGKEIRFMRKFLGMTTTELGKSLGVTHVTILKWEKSQNPIAHSLEPYMRMVFFERFKDTELTQLYKEIRPETLANAKHEPATAFRVNAKELRAENF